MVQVPTYRDRANVADPGGRIRVVAGRESFGGQSAAALSGVAQGVGDLAKGIDTMNLRMDEANAKELAVAYDEFERKTLLDPTEGYLTNKRGRDALDLRQKTQADLEAFGKALVQRGRSDQSKRALEALLTTRLADAAQRMDLHAAREFDVYENGLSEANVAAAGKSLLASWGSPDHVAKQAGVIKGEAEAMGRRLGLSAEQVNQSIDDTLGALYADGFMLDVARDPRAVLDAMRKGEGLAEKIGPARREQIAKAAQNEIDRRQAKWESNVRRTLNSQLDLLKMGVIPKDVLSANLVRSALGDDAAQAWESAIGNAQTQQTFQGAPSDYLMSFLTRPAEALKPDGSNLEAYRIDQYQRAAASEILQQRSADPRGFWEQRGLVEDRGSVMEPLKAGKWDDVGALLKQRKADAETVGAKLKMPGQLLNKAEAVALGGMLETMQPIEQAAMLNGFAGALGTGDAYKTLMKQVAGETSPSVGYAGYLTSQKRPLGAIEPAKAAQVVLEGQALLYPTTADGKKAPAAFTMPKKAETDLAWKTATGGGKDKPSVYRNGGESAAKEAYLAAYAGLAKRKGLTNGEYDSESAKAAALIATGGTGKVFGTLTVLPWGLSADRVESAIEYDWGKIVAKYPDALGGTDPKDWDFVIAGDGQYTLMAGEQMALRDGLNPIVISIRPRNP